MMNNDYFYCYSPNLKARLLTAGERFICVGINESTSRKFWLFKQGDNVSTVLSKWTADRVKAD